MPITRPTVFWSYPSQDAGTAEGDARWLVEFAALDLDSLSPAAREELATRIRLFLHGAHVVAEDPAGVPDARTIRGIQESVRLGLQGLFTGLMGNWGYPFHVEEVLWRRKRDGTMWIEARHTGTVAAAFCWKALHVLQVVGHRLRRCEDLDCGRFFIATKRQRFCSPRHAGRLRMQRWLKDKEHREKARGTQAQAYAKRMRRRLGQKVKIMTRKKEG